MAGGPPRKSKVKISFTRPLKLKGLPFRHKSLVWWNELMRGFNDTTKTVLLVDDFEDNRFMMRRLLEMSGYRVLEAANPVLARRSAAWCAVPYFAPTP